MEYASLTSLIKHLEGGSRSTNAIELISKNIVVKASKELSQYIGGKGCNLTLLLELFNTIQHACKLNNDCSIHLIQVGILNLMNVIFTKILETLTRDGFCKPLQAVIEIGTETANVVGESNATAKNNVVSVLLPIFLDLLGHKQLAFQTRFEVLKSTNMLMEQSCIETREKLLQNDLFNTKVVSTVQLIKHIGDYEFQVGLVECLMRLFPKKSRRLYASQLFPDMEMAQGFLDIKDRSFEVDCRVFLNEVNARSEDPTKGVFSFPCVSAFVEDRQLEKPSDDGYEQFWVDFNIGSGRISLFCEQNTLLSQGSCMDEELWETVAISKTDLQRCAENVVNEMIHLEITLKNPLCEIYPSQHRSMTSNKVLIIFDRDLHAHVTHAVKYTFCSVTKSKVSAVQRPLKISTKEVQLIDSQSQNSVSEMAHPMPSPVQGSNDSVGKRCRVSVPIVALDTSSHRSTPLVSPKPVESKVKATEEKGKVHGRCSTEKQQTCQSSDKGVKLPEDRTSVSESSDNADEAVSDDRCRVKKASKPKLSVPKTAPITPPAKKNAKPKVKTPVVTVTPQFKRTRGRLAKEKGKAKTASENPARVNASKKKCSDTNKADNEEHTVVIPDSLPLNKGKEKSVKQKKIVSASKVKTMDDSGVGIDDSRSTFGNISMSSVTVNTRVDKQPRTLRSEVPGNIKPSRNKTTNNSLSEKCDKQEKVYADKCKSSLAQKGVISNNELRCTADKSISKRNGTQLHPEDTSVHQEAVAKDKSSFGNNLISTEHDVINEDATAVNVDVQQETVCVNVCQNEPESIPDSIENQLGDVDETVSCINASDGDDQDATDNLTGGDINCEKELKPDKSFKTKVNEEPDQESKKVKEIVEQLACVGEEKARSNKSNTKKGKCKKGKKSFTDVDMSLKELCDLDLPRSRRGRKSCNDHVDVQHSKDMKVMGDELRTNPSETNDIPQPNEDVYSFCEPDKDFNKHISTEKKSVKLDKEQKKPKQKTAESDKINSKSKRKSNRSKDKSTDVASTSFDSRNMHSLENAEIKDTIEEECTLMDKKKVKEKDTSSKNDSANCKKGVNGSHQNNNFDVGVANEEQCFGKEKMKDIERTEFDTKRSENRRTSKTSFDLSKNSYHIVSCDDMSPSINDNSTPEIENIGADSIRSSVKEHFVEKEERKKSSVKKYDNTAASKNNDDCTEIKPALMNTGSSDVKKTTFKADSPIVSEESDSLYIESDDSYNARRFKMDGNRFKRSEKKKKISKKTKATMQADIKHTEDSCSDTETDLLKNTASKEIVSKESKKKTQSKAKNPPLNVTKSRGTENTSLVADSRCNGRNQNKSKQNFPSHEMDEAQNYNDCSVTSQANTKKKNMIFQMTYSHCQTKYSSKGLVQSYSACKQNIAYDPYDFDAHCDDASMKSERLERQDISKDFKKRHKEKAEVKTSPEAQKSKSASMNHQNVIQKKYHNVEKENKSCVDSDTSIQNSDISPVCSVPTPLMVQDKGTNRWYRNPKNVNQQKTIKSERNKQEHQIELPNCTREKDSPEIVECVGDSPVQMELDDHNTDDNNDTLNTFSRMVKNFEASREVCGKKSKSRQPSNKETGANKENSKKNSSMVARSKKDEGSRGKKQWEDTNKSMIIDNGYREIERMRRMSPRLGISIGDISIETPVLDDSLTSSPEVRPGNHKPMDVQCIKQFSSGTINIGTPNERCGSSETRKRSRRRRRKSISYKDLSDSDDSLEASTTEKSVETSMSFLNNTFSSTSTEKSWIRERKKPSRKKDMSKTYCRPHQTNKWDRLHHSQDDEESDDVEKQMDITSLPVPSICSLPTPSISLQLNTPNLNATPSERDISAEDFQFDMPSLRLSDLGLPEGSGSVKSKCSSKIRYSSKFSDTIPNDCSRSSSSQSSEKRARKKNRQELQKVTNLSAPSICSLPMPSISLQLNTPNLNVIPSDSDMSTDNFQSNIPSLRLSDLDLLEGSASMKSKCSSKCSSQSMGKRGSKKNWQEIQDLQDMIEMPVTPLKTGKQKNEVDNIEEIQTQEYDLIHQDESCDNDDEIEIGSVSVSGLLKTPQLYLEEEAENEKFENEANNAVCDMADVLPASGLMSGPSSEVRPSRSVLKRKFPNVVVDTDGSNTSDPESDTEMERSTLIPKKLFKLAPAVDRQTSKLSSLPSICSEVTDDTDMDLLQSNVSFMQSFGADIQKQMQEKKKKLKSWTLSTKKEIQKNFNQKWVEQQQYFSNTNDNYSAKMMVELSNLEKIIDKSKEMENKTEEMFRYQMEMLRSNESAHRNCLKNMRRNQEDLRGRTKKVVAYNKNVHTSAQEQLKKSMASLKQKLVQDTQRQELMNVSLGLQKLFGSSSDGSLINHL